MESVVPFGSIMLVWIVDDMRILLCESNLIRTIFLYSKNLERLRFLITYGGA